MSFELPPLALLAPLGGAVVVYLFLRWVVWAPRVGASAATVSQHALWVGIIGWMASSLQGAVRAGQIPANPNLASGSSTAADLVQLLGWPVLAALAVHAIGQLSYPAPKQARRHAELAVRRIRDFLPRKLAWTTAGILVVSLLFMVQISALPGFDPVLPEPQPTPATGGPLTGGPANGGRDGRIPGAVLAAWLGGALLVLAAGTWLVLWLIARRRHLETLDGEDNRALRTIAMNRLLRTVSTIAAGLAAVAGNFALATPPGVLPDGPGLPLAGLNVPVLVNLVVLLAMWWWHAGDLPSLAAAKAAERGTPLSHDPAAHPAARLSASIGVGLGVVAGMPLLAGLFFIPALAAAGAWGLPGMVAFVAALLLLAIAAGELVIRANYGKADAPVEWPAQPVSRGLLATAIVAAFLLVSVLVITAVGQNALYQAPVWPAVAGVTAVVLAAGGVALLAARFRRGVPDAGGGHGLDGALRAISMYRIVRTLAAYCLFQAGLVLMTTSHALPPLFRDPRSFVPEDAPAAIAAGAVLAAVAVAIAITPVRRLLRDLPAPAGSRSEEASR
ncbi:hypothetical protein [Arthrobacter sp. CJ23]|uniref:hypothetical protein n=1 Tax=Arthrobacter sp. CJ23 TaxID=2972479 RepID=UPI00215BC21D|nr:hypothetical protein [Arthrobacter sp. CJ23]UVJ38601.1 hypothetical protein NVV90_15415 [Arthrobacter sp. CJ23]